MNRVPGGGETIVATESDLRDALRGTSARADSGAAGPGGVGSGPGLDGTDVIRRARARRRPKQVAFGAVGALALAGFAYVGVTAMPGSLSTPMSAFDSGAVVESSSDGGAGFGPQSEESPRETPVDRIAADDVNSCGAEVVALPPNENGLVLTPHFPAVVPADGATVKGTVTLTNAGTEAISGHTAVEAAITLSRDGVTVWHSYATEVSHPWSSLRLAPGQSIDYPAEFTPVLCRNDWDLRPEYADDLPPLDAGEYEVSAYLFLGPAAGDYTHDVLLGGPAQRVTLR